MKHKILIFLVLIIFPVIFDSCVTKKKRNETGAAGKFYHNTTAYYNGYWNANEILKESMRTLRTANADDYNKILEVEDYISIDNPKMVKGDMDKIIEKVTTVAQLHEPSDWVDDCYVMMAKAQYLKQEYETAEETLEYFQEDFNPSNPYGRNYKSKKLTGKAAKKAREAETKEKAKEREAEKDKKEEERKKLAEEKEAEKKQIAEAKEEERKAAAKLKEEEKKEKEAVKKDEAKTREQKKKEADKERERVRKEKEKQRKEDAKNRKKGIKTTKPATTAPKPAETKKTAENLQPAKPAKTETKPTAIPKKEIAKTIKAEPKKQEEAPETVEEKPAKTPKPEEDKTAYSEGLLWLAKTYIKRENWFSAEMLLQKLTNSAVNDAIKSELPATYANLYIKQKRYEEAIPKLEEAIETEDDKHLKSRYAFIAAQLYQQKEQFKKAQQYFEIAKKYARSPKLEFMAELASARTSIQSGSRSKSDVLSDLKRMLSDVKNNDVKDQIYFTMAEIELSQNNIDLAIENFKNSLANNISDQKLKTESYYQIAQLQYHKELYLSATAYYDSTLSNLQTSDPRYVQVQKLAGNLKDIAANIENINYLDTLIYFAGMSQDDRKKAIPPYLARNQKQQSKSIGSGNIVTKNPTDVFVNMDFGQSSFFAYNRNTKQQGKENFEKVWGRRPLSDDWRRSARSIGAEEDKDESKIAESSGEKIDIANVEEYEKYLRELPTNPIKKQETNDRIMNSMFTLGKLFRDKIENYSKSALTLEDMHLRYGATPNEAESYFYLYLDYLDLNNLQKADEYKNKLSTKYPTSAYNAILNQSKNNDSGIKTNKSDEHYKSAYTLFESGKYAEALTLLDKTTEAVGDNHNYHARISLLKAMCMGGKDGKDAYIMGLNDVIRDYPNTPEHLKAREIMRLLGGDQSAFSTVQDVDKIFEREREATHYVVVITYNTEESKHVNLKVAISEYNKKQYKTERLQQGDATLNIEANTQVILVRKFDNEDKAIQYSKRALQDKSEFSGGADYTFDVLPISQSNYRKMLSERSSVSYRTYYENVIAPDSGNK